jgi:HK97 family phage major capsid protein
VTLTSDGVLNPVRQIARVETIAGNTWNGVASQGVVAGFSAEFTETTDNSPTLTQPTANVEKAQVFVPYSIEAGEDWAALGQEMSKLIVDAKDVLEATKFLTGAGHSSHEPNGFLVGATTVVNTAATAVFAIRDVYSLIETLPPRFLPRAKFVAHRTTFDTMYRFVGGGNTTEPPLFSNFDRGAGVLGFPKYEWNNYTSASTAPSSSGSILTVGDWSHFRILDRIGMSIELVPHVFGTANNYPIGARGLYGYWRTTSIVEAPNAFRTLKVL